MFSRISFLLLAPLGTLPRLMFLGDLAIVRKLGGSIPHRSLTYETPLFLQVARC
jgi:hypothetical protein